MDETSLRWEAFEDEHREKTEDWFWALWIIVITAALSSIIYGDYFFAVLIILGGILLAHFAKRQPQVVSYELNYRGLKIGSRIYPYQHIKSFWVEANVEDRRT